eukprot:CAMPEP_0114579162 /NCGR_PEP_ID=MMETSP0125-20121206/3590_1 /TAXON_ID=485358 ORGANISM="Aristerostoma sp., Strain ATCC 50986" /NCGR_SAMPLE_ID=MMETSP0125 /ASSEMBLY_ACC=CAM_ASM_000245 /LENGTH=45 /DNA_ID= /DNA_START= /DNA_END= /DNA_ORIENTATION=
MLKMDCHPKERYLETGVILLGFEANIFGLEVSEHYALRMDVLNGL